MARKPKVFTWSDGFHAYTVATTSKAKALEAWGVARDLFKDGEAREVESGPEMEAALAAPGEVIRGGVSVDLGKLTKTRPKAKPEKAERPSEPPKPSKADIARRKALEREIDSLDRDAASLETEISARRARLEREAAERRAEIEKRRKAAQSELDDLRTKLDRG